MLGTFPSGNFPRVFVVNALFHKGFSNMYLSKYNSDSLDYLSLYSVYRAIYPLFSTLKPLQGFLCFFPLELKFNELVNPAISCEAALGSVFIFLRLHG